jgi:hypothetical protein
MGAVHADEYEMIFSKTLGISMAKIPKIMPRIIETDTGFISFFAGFSPPVSIE